MIFHIAVGVALSRPPRTEETVYLIIEARNENTAHLIAQQMACCMPGVVMPTESRTLP